MNYNCFFFCRQVINAVLTKFVDEVWRYLGSSKQIEQAVTESETTHKALIDAHHLPHYDGAAAADDDDDDGGGGGGDDDIADHGAPQRARQDQEKDETNAPN